jgi:mRNA-degrading endonuclease toxin of MazEF toxin-antitoxin module
MKYKKGDIVIIRFPFSDLTKTKKRPALIISNDIVNKTGDYLMVPPTYPYYATSQSAGRKTSPRNHTNLQRFFYVLQKP